MKLSLTKAYALLRERQGRFAEAKTIYREVLQKDPRDQLALNNLAYILALEGGAGGEALSLVQRAIDASGPSGAMLDTRATAHLGMRNYDLAITDLRAAVAETPTPTRYYHLAVAYHGTNRRGEALKALNKAKETGLQANRLHLLERASCEKLLVELASN